MEVPAVLTCIIIENYLDNLHNHSRHKESSSDSGSDSLHFITFFFNHEQQVALHWYSTSSSLEMAALPLTFSLSTQTSQN